MAAPAFVKENGHNTSLTSTTTKTITIASAPGAGNLLLASSAFSSGTTATATLTDSRGNTWTRQRGVTNGDAGCVFSTLQDVAPLQVGDVLTFSWGGTAVVGWAGAVHEFSGFTQTVDVSNTSAVDTTTARDSGSVTTTRAVELVFAAYEVDGLETSFTPGAGFTVPTTAFYGVTTCSVEFQWKITAAAGAVNATGTGGFSGLSGGVVMAFFAAAPVNTVAPVASGTTTVGSVLSVTNGTWNDDGAPTFSYQWQRDVAGNGVYSNISLATSSTYTLVSADTGCHVRCVVTDGTADGNTAANSNALGLITGTGLSSPISGHNNPVSAHSGVTGATEVTQHTGNSGTPIESHSGVTGYTAVEQH